MRNSRMEEHKLESILLGEISITSDMQMTSPLWASLVAQRLKHLPGMWETWVQSLGQEDPQEKEMATHSSLLPGKSHGLSSLVGYRPWGGKESDTTERLHFHFPGLYH